MGPAGTQQDTTCRGSGALQLPKGSLLKMSSNFQSRDLDMPIRCTHCKKSTPVTAWRCACNRPWHVCPVHRNHHNGDGGRLKQSSRTDESQAINQIRNSPRWKRKRPPDQDFEEIAAQDERKAQRRREKGGTGKRDRQIVLDEAPGFKIPRTLLSSLRRRLWGNNNRDPSSSAA